MQDEKIVELYFDRDELAVKETEAKFGKYLYKIAFSILKDNADSEESVNDTYLAAWNSIPPNKPSRLSTYLGKLTRRISIDLFRRKNSKKRVASQYALTLNELGECIKDKNSMEEDMENKALGLAINDFLRTLSKESRVLFVSRYYFCDSLKDSAKHLGMSEAKAKSSLFRTRQKLRDYLIKEGFEV